MISPTRLILSLRSEEIAWRGKCLRWADPCTRFQKPPGSPVPNWSSKRSRRSTPHSRPGRRRLLTWSSLHLNIPHLSQHYYGNTSSLESQGFGGAEHRAEVADALKYAADQHRSEGTMGMRALERVYRAEAMKYLRTGKTDIPCSALTLTSYLPEKGEVYPCTIWNKPLGNVRKTNFALMPIIEEARKKGVQKTIRARKCPNC